MLDNIKIILPTGKKLKYNFNFSEAGTLEFIPIKGDAYSKILLANNKCPICPLSEKEYICPAAEIIAYYTNTLSYIKSYEKIEIEYSTHSNPNEIIKQEVTAQALALEFMKIATFQTHCPIGRELKSSIMKLPEFIDEENFIDEMVKFFNEDNKHLINSYIEIFEHLMERFRDRNESDAKINAFINFHSLMRLLAEII